MREPYTILCANCRVAIEPDGREAGMFRCPQCNVRADGGTARRETAEYIHDAMGNALVLALKDATQGSKTLKVTAEPRALRKHRFMIDLEL